jgi:hypothetical protein
LQITLTGFMFLLISALLGYVSYISLFASWHKVEVIIVMIFQYLTTFFIFPNDRQWNLQFVEMSIWSIFSRSILLHSHAREFGYGVNGCVETVNSLSITLKFRYLPRYTLLNWTPLLQDGFMLHMGYFCFYTSLVQFSYCSACSISFNFQFDWVYDTIWCLYFHWLPWLSWLLFLFLCVFILWYFGVFIYVCSYIYLLDIWCYWWEATRTN